MADHEDNQPPWPACADCQVTTMEEQRKREGPITAMAGNDAREETCDDMPLSQDFGPWTAELRRRAADALARAQARAREETAGKDEHAEVDAKVRRA